MTDQFYSAPSTLARLHAGPLGPYIDGFTTLLYGLGLELRYWVY